jgi:hypothetical protein
MVRKIENYNLRRKIVEELLDLVDVEVQKLTHLVNASQPILLSDLQQMFNNIEAHAVEHVISQKD